LTVLQSGINIGVMRY